MTDTYTAPTNGHKIRSTSDGGLRINKPGMDYAVGHEPQTLVAGRVESLREYFRDERDRELGRWRSKEDPDYYVIPYYSNPDTVTVVYERDNRDQVAHRSEDYNVLRGFKEVGEEYFAAHPEKKPWHDAKHLEIWVLTIQGCPSEAYIYREGYPHREPAFRPVNHEERVQFAPTDSKIVGGRRIWPEGG